MPIRLALISFSCVAFISCAANAELKSPQKLIAPQSSKNLKQTTENLAIDEEKCSEIDVLKNSNSGADNNESNSHMTLIPKRVFNALNNPIYQLCLYVNGELKHGYNTVSGREATQEKDRNSSGTEAPLPDGRYKIARTYIRGTIPEAGDRFLPIQPLFSTGRTALGIHYDPSFEKNNGEDGTSGCIGLTNKQDLNKVLEYVRTYHPQYLEVKI